ncbi:MAG: hypothetical protein JKP95_01925 [Oceanicaulis sp.]|nr:hypothetical protein [Oceanicaulis sp.]
MESADIGADKSILSDAAAASSVGAAVIDAGRLAGIGPPVAHAVSGSIATMAAILIVRFINQSTLFRGNEQEVATPWLTISPSVPCRQHDLPYCRSLGKRISTVSPGCASERVRVAP